MIIKKITPTLHPSSADLLLFFAGWGMDEHPFTGFLPTDRDCMICYNYSSLSWDQSLFTAYNNIDVIAWSMGVWAATRILSENELPVRSSVAINGTPWPVNDDKGIATAIFQGTLNGLNEITLQKFRRRMCGSKESLIRFMEHAPQRTIEDLREELQKIGERSQENTVSPFSWNQVYIGSQDKIFLPGNQQNAWQGHQHINLIECEHYPENFWIEVFHKYNR